MQEHEVKQSDKVQDNTKHRKRKPLEYQRFERFLKQVIKAPPLRKTEPPHEPS